MFNCFPFVESVTDFRGEMAIVRLHSFSPI